MPRFDVLVDGERSVRLRSEDDVRAWIRRYREEHAGDDPDATHVQIVRTKLFGGTMLPLDRFVA